MKILILVLVFHSMAFAALGDRATKTQEIDPALEKEFERKELEKKMLIEKARQKKIEVAKKLEEEKKRKEQEKINEAKRKEKEKVVQEILELKKKNAVTPEKTFESKPKESPTPAPKIIPPMKTAPYEPKKAEKFRKSLKVLPKTCKHAEDLGDKDFIKKNCNLKSSIPAFSGSVGGPESVMKCPDTDEVGEHYLFHLKSNINPVYSPRVTCKQSVENCEVNYKNNNVGYRCYWKGNLVFWREEKK